MEGTNFVELVGQIRWPQLKTVGEGQHKLFKSKLAIPVSDDRFQYLKIAAWRGVAEALNALAEDSFIKVHGHIEERSYDGKCKGCGGAEKKYWTEVVVDNFIVVDN